MAGAPFDLHGRAALVTGANRGIGRAIAVGLAKAGADVAVHEPLASEEGADLVRGLADLGVRAVRALGDFAEPGAAVAAAEAAERALGRIDILILNASIEIRQPWLEIAAADVETQVAVDFQSSLSLCQVLVPAMAARGFGRVVAIGSIQEARPNPQLVVYAALKAAQTNMMVNLARQYAAQGVTFNTVAPGAIETARNAAVLADAAYRSRVEAQIPMRSLGQPEDVVGACLLLASPAGRYITGTTLFVDGGWHVS
jgi:NAD(P)-dependent dehydrogenase (short-subunit alcohol dehydrogenase family)